MGNVLKDFTVDNMKKNGYYGYFFNFPVDYDVIAVDDILDIHKYLMKENDRKLYLDLFKNNVIGVLSTCTTASF